MSEKVSGFFSAREFYMTEMKSKRVASRSTGNTEIEAKFSMWTQIALSYTNLTSPVAIMKREKRDLTFKM